MAKANIEEESVTIEKTKVTKKIGNAVKASTAKGMEITRHSIDFWTDHSKKVTLAMLFLISVIVDQVWLKNAIYGENQLYDSNVFKGILFTVTVIAIKDFQSVITNISKKYFS